MFHISRMMSTVLQRQLLLLLLLFSGGQGQSESHRTFCVSNWVCDVFGNYYLPNDVDRNLCVQTKLLKVAPSCDDIISLKLDSGLNVPAQENAVYSSSVELE